LLLPLLAAACAVPGASHGDLPSAALRLGLPADAPLPTWAATLAGPLPATTFQLLALDHRHRAAHPLGPAISAVVRERVARHLGCETLVRTAQSDLAAVAAAARAPAVEDAASAFAAAMVEAPQSIPESTHARAVACFGAGGVVALVHTVAYTNFQARLLMGLGLGDGAAEAQLAWPIDAVPPDVPAPVRPSTTSATSAALVPVGWRSSTALELQARKERQWVAVPRLPPPHDEQLARLGDRERGQAERIVWSRYGYGYQPELTRDWIAALHTFYREAKVDPILENSVFWIVTRSNDCFY
jgi:hypothetical protein